jgi:EamA domain-containing membrane protein RarD
MKLNAPKVITWWIALALAVIGVILQLVGLAAVPWLGFVLVVVAAALLLIATYLPNL